MVSMLAGFATIAWGFLTANYTAVYDTRMYASVPLFAFMLSYRPEVHLIDAVV